MQELSLLHVTISCPILMLGLVQTIDQNKIMLYLHDHFKDFQFEKTNFSPGHCYKS